MPLDPALAELLAFIDSAGHPPMHESSPEDARKALSALAQLAVAQGGRVEVGSVADGSAAGVPVRVYRPTDDGPLPTVVYFHGGGWVIGDLHTHDNTCRRLCRDTSSVVVSVDYRLAPEHPFPAAVEDALAATRAVRDDLASYGGSEVWAVAGDSAGGNLAAIVTQELPGAGAQLLIYPGVDLAGEHVSREENGTGYFLDTATMMWFVGHYLPPESVLDDPRLSPLHGDLAGLPPAVVATAEFDPLRDEGMAYAQALAAAGVPTDAVTYDGMIHGFADMAAFSPAADAAIADMFRRFGALMR